MNRIKHSISLWKPGWLLASCLLIPAAARAVSPLFTDDADTVPKGKFQLGAGVQYDKVGSLRRWSAPVNPVIGLTERWEAGVNFGYQWQEQRGFPGTVRADGALDTTLATKWKWFDQTNHWFSLSTRLDFKIPTASDGKQLGTGQTDVGGVLIATKAIGATSCDFNLGYTFFDTGGTGFRDDELFVGQTIRHSLSQRWTLVGEVFGRVPFSNERDVSVDFNGGVQFFLRSNLVLEAAALTAIGRNSPDFTGWLGLTWVF